MPSTLPIQNSEPKKMANRTSDLLGRVDPSLQLDETALLRYASANVHGFPPSPSTFTISQFVHGQSNPTYLLEASSDGSRASTMRYVLRKKPLGKLLDSAHAIEREFQVLQTLAAHTRVPVPKVFCLCTESSVIGTPFYIMEYLEGRIFIDPRLPGVAPERRREIYRATAKVLASVHCVDVDAIGLGKYGHRDNYCKRQIERWARQYIASTGEGKAERNPKMIQLVNWLRQNIPSEDSSGATSGLVHGDFRLDNLVFHPTEDRVIGILDWELSTLGNQMCDVAYSSLNYVADLTIDRENISEGIELAGIPHGIPPLAEYLAEYCSSAQKPWPASLWRFYVAFSLFRGAAIGTSIYSRWIMGNSSAGERARHSGNKANALIESTWAFINRKYVLPDNPPSGALTTRDESFPRTGRFVQSKNVLEIRNKL